MATFVFVEKFDRGFSSALPFEKVCELLENFGNVRRGIADFEVYFDTAKVAEVCIIVGSETEGVRGLGFKNPYFDEGFRDLIWRLMQEFACTVYDGLLREVQVIKGHLEDLPLALVQNHVRQISSTFQLWPDRLLRTGRERIYPVLRYTNRIEGAPNVQFFDHLLNQNNEIQLDVELLLAACNPLTLRFLKSLCTHIDHGLIDNPTLQAGLRFIDAEVALQFVESPAITTQQKQIKIISPFPGSSNAMNEFSVDFAVVDEQAQFELQLKTFLKEKHGLEIDHDQSGFRVLLKLLSQLHGEYQRRIQDASSKPEQNAAFVHSWAQILGAFLGNYLRLRVGGQWGFIERRSNQVSVLQTYRGRTVFPHLLVLDHIVNGVSSSIEAAFHELEKTDQSACPRFEDFVRNVPEYCGLFQGKSHDRDRFRFPLELELDSKYFDFSLTSLQPLDEYVELLRQHRNGLSEKELIDACIAVAAYLGETVRRNAKSHSQWRWFTYDDYVVEHPDFSQRRERQLSTLMILEGTDFNCYPIGTVLAMVQSSDVGSNDNCRSFAAQLLTMDETSGVATAVSPRTLNEATAELDRTIEPAKVHYVAERAITRVAADATSSLLRYIPFLLGLFILGLSFQEAWVAHRDAFLHISTAKRSLLRAWISVPAVFLALVLLLNKRRFMYDAALLMGMIISLFASYAIYGMNDVKVKDTGDYSAFLWLPVVQLVFIGVWLSQIRRHREHDGPDDHAI